MRALLAVAALAAALRAACAATDAAARKAAAPTVGLHCFVCWSGQYLNCEDPFSAVDVPIEEFDSKSVCYKFRKGPDVWRGGMSEALYLKMYENGSLDEYPLRLRCSGHLCNGAATAHALALLLLPLTLLLLAAAAGSAP